MKKICFLIDTPILKSYRSYYALDALAENGIDYILVDTSPLINKMAHLNVKKDLIDYNRENVYLCKNWKELGKVLSQLGQGAVAIDSGSYELGHLRVYRYLKKYRIPYGYMILNSCYETAAQLVDTKTKIKNFIKTINPKKILNSIFVRLPRKWSGIDPASFVISNAATEIDGFKKRFYCNSVTKFLIVHSNAYEEALEHRTDKRLINEKYCVWIDSYVPYHPDLSQIPGANIDDESYYRALRSFFHWIEEHYDLKVVVAAHPRSDYTKHNEAYEGFQIYKLHTCELVRNAEFVLSAASASFLYAITYNKPILFIYQKALFEGLKCHIDFINVLANELGTRPLYIDGEEISKEKIDRLLVIHKDKYKKIAEKYVKNGFNGKIEGKSYKKQIADFLRNI